MRPYRSYKTFIAARTDRNPCLQDLSDLLSKETTSQPSQHACRAVCIEFFTGSRPPNSQSLDFSSLASLLSNHRKNSDGCCGRILIIEDLSKDVVEMLGSMLNIDPLFFASHIDTHQINMATKRPSVATLPSTARSQNFLNLHYHRVIQFENPMPRQTLLRSMNLRRKVKVLPNTEGITIGIVRHCCSVLETVGLDGLWLGLVLVDAPISNSYIQTRQSDGIHINTRIQTRLFKGGFQDIRPVSAICIDDDSEIGPLQASPLETLLSCWQCDQPWESNINGLTLLSLAHHPLRMVAAEWMIYLELMFHSIKQYEYSANSVPAALEHIAVLQTDIHALQQWFRRSMSTSQKIRHAIRFLRYWASEEADKPSRAIMIEDYKEIASQIDTYTHRLETSVSIATSLIQAIDCRRSLTETENIARLTYLALSFIPLTFVSGLFSMNERVAPGGKHFWLYFAVAIPLCMAVFLVVRLPRFSLTSLAVRS